MSLLYSTLIFMCCSTKTFIYIIIKLGISVCGVRCFMVQNIPIIIFPVQSDRDLVLLCCMTDVRGRWTSFDSSAYIMSDRIRSHLGAEQGVHRLQTLKLECFWIPDKVHVFCIFTFYYYLQYNDCERMNTQYLKLHFSRLQRWKITFYLGVVTFAQGCRLDDFPFVSRRMSFWNLKKSLEMLSKQCV